MIELRPPAAFLSALGDLLDVAAADDPSIEGRGKAIEDLHATLQTLLRQNAFPSFLFRYGEVEYEGELLDELRSWPWSGKLPDAGVDRLEISPGTTREDIEGFVDEIASRLFLRGGGDSLREVAGQFGIRFQELDPNEGTVPVETPPQLRIDLDAEAGAARWLADQVAEHGVVPSDEASAVVQLLSIAMHSEKDVVVPLVELKTVDQYTTTHSMNVSCLSMALAEHLRYASSDVRAIGEAALLHDVGKTRIPLEVLNKKGKLTAEEWALMQTHTSEGAKMLLQSSGKMELAAIVAYEHHLTWRGGGYPEMTRPRQPHEVSRLIQVCDIYDALRTRRPFRPPWPHDRALEYIGSKAGETLDPEYVDAFLSVIRQWEPRQVVLADAEEA